MISRRLTIAVAALTALVATSASIYIRQSGERNRNLVDPEPALNSPPGRVPDPVATARLVGISQEPSRTDPSAVRERAELAEQVAELSQAVCRLERTVTDLDQRIARSKLAVPTQEELRAKLRYVEPEVQRQRQSYSAAVVDLQRLARQGGLQLHDDLLTSLGVRTILDSDVAFRTARDRAIQARRGLESMELYCATLTMDLAINTRPAPR